MRKHGKEDQQRRLSAGPSIDRAVLLGLQVEDDVSVLTKQLAENRRGRHDDEISLFRSDISPRHPSCVFVRFRSVAHALIILQPQLKIFPSTDDVTETP